MKLIVYDIETLIEDFVICLYNRETKERSFFEINKDVNDLYKMIKFFEGHQDYHWVGFNNLSFDNQILEYIMRYNQKWYDNDNLQICRKLWQKAQDVISDINYGLFPPYREEELTLKPLDLFKIHHFDNEAKMTSLKWVAFMLDMIVEEMPIAHDQKDLTTKDLQDVLHYCWNDVTVTDRLLEVTLGNSENEEYKGKNKIQERLDVIAEFGLPEKALNWSDVKLGDELNLLGYMKQTGKDRKQVYELKKARRPTKNMTFGSCIPKYVTFETKPFQDFYERIAKERVSLSGEGQEFLFTYNGTTYCIAKGGIHSADPKRAVIPRKGERCRDADVGAQYPNAIIKRKLYPIHLGEGWLTNYVVVNGLKTEYKAKGKKATDDMEKKRLKGIETTFKLALNGGGFGKTNEPNSWQYGPEVTFSCTIGNQFEILMLVEKHESTGIHVISANTDGIVSLYPEELQEQYDKNCKWWEEKVGNSIEGKLEFTDFQKLYQLSVNNYIAIKDDGKAKKKGRDFSTDHQLHRNKSRRIIPLALEKYFVEGIPVEKSIKEHTNLFDFCIGVKSSREYHYETINPVTGENQIHKKLIRYYVSKNGLKLLKVKNQGSEADGNDLSECEAPDKTDGRVWLCSLLNDKDSSNVPAPSEVQIDYEYYIRKAKTIISYIEKPRSKKLPPENPNQGNLF